MATYDLSRIFPNCKGVFLYPPKDRTPKDFFRIAEKVYDDIKPNRMYKNIQCWCVYTVSNESTGYFGAAFLDLRMDIKSLSNPGFRPRVIIAHRGTNLSELKDLKNDFTILKQEIPIQFMDACMLMGRTFGYFRRRDLDVVHSGHSLGAALAQMCAFKFNHKSIGFETPGTAGILYLIDPKRPLNNDQYISFTMDGSYISQSLPHIGKVFIGKKQIYSSREGSLLDVFDNITLLHRMGNMKPFFNSDGNFITNPKMLKIKR
jgi:hypothetical protein